MQSSPDATANEPTPEQPAVGEAQQEFIQAHADPAPPTGADVPCGIIYNEPARVYHATRAVSWYRLARFDLPAGGSPAAYHWEVVQGKLKMSTKSLARGQAAHCLLLEGEAAFQKEFKVIPENMKFNTSEGKRWERDFKSGIEKHKTLLEFKEEANLRYMEMVFRAKPEISERLECGRPEVVVRRPHFGTGLLRQCRFDWLDEERQGANDYKTTAEPLERFNYEVRKRRLVVDEETDVVVVGMIRPQAADDPAQIAHPPLRRSEQTRGMPKVPWHLQDERLVDVFWIIDANQVRRCHAPLAQHPVDGVDPRVASPIRPACPRRELWDLGRHALCNHPRDDRQTLDNGRTVAMDRIMPLPQHTLIQMCRRRTGSEELDAALHPEENGTLLTMDVTTADRPFPNVLHETLKVEWKRVLIEDGCAAKGSQKTYRVIVPEAIDERRWLKHQDMDAERPEDLY